MAFLAARIKTLLLFPLRVDPDLVCCCMPLILVFRRQRWADLCELKAILSYIVNSGQNSQRYTVRFCLKKKRKKKVNPITKTGQFPQESSLL